MGRRPTLFQYLSDPDAYPSVTFRPDPNVRVTPQAVPRRGQRPPRTRMTPSRMGASSSRDLASQAGALAEEPIPAPHVPFSVASEAPALLFLTPPGSAEVGGPPQSPATFAPPNASAPQSWDIARALTDERWRNASALTAKRETLEPYLGFSNLSQNGLSDERALLPEHNPMLMRLFELVYGPKRQR